MTKPIDAEGSVGLLLSLLLIAGCGSLPADSRREPPRNHEAPRTQEARESLYAFTGVTVVPMTGERLLPHRTVLVRGQVIEAIGPTAEVQVPEDAVVIEGRGRYLMPGLVDMHTHISDRDDLVLLLANGVTSVRNMAEYPGWARLLGYPDILALKKRIEKGELQGPTIYTAGLVLDGRKPVSPLFSVMKDAGEAERAVRDQQARGYDFVKVYDKLPPEVYERIVAVARELQITVIGHVPKAVGIDASLSSGQHSIEHLTGYIDNDKSRFVIPEERIEEYAARTAAAGVWNCPTLTIYDNLVPPSRFEEILAHPEARYVPGRIRFLWKQTLRAVYETAGTGGDVAGGDVAGADVAGTDYAARMGELSRRMTRALHEAGAKLVAGTDMNFVGVFPGLSLHRELEDLVAAGLSPYEALACATVNAAVCLGRAGEFGTVDAGGRADLILLETDPLEDVGAIRSCAGVMVRGRWYSRDALERMREEL